MASFSYINKIKQQEREKKKRKNSLIKVFKLTSFTLNKDLSFSLFWNSAPFKREKTHDISILIWNK